MSFINNTMEHLSSRGRPEAPIGVPRQHKIIQPCARKNLNELFEVTPTDADTEENVSVYLRIKPTTLGENIRDGNTVKSFDAKHLHFIPPKEHRGVIKSKVAVNPVEFTFSHIYGPDISQEELFDNCVYPQIANFLQGNSCLLFSYGTSNAGKTYTILGKLSQPGIIPRSFHLLFASIGERLTKSMRYKPDMDSDTVRLDDVLVAQEERFKDNIMRYYEDSATQYKDVYKMSSLCPGIAGTTYGCTDYSQMAQMMDNNKIVPLENDGYKYAVWVSFIEIYNEAVYDLLVEPIPMSGKRTQLKVPYDKGNCSYVKGVKYVCVQSAEEAYKVLIVGKRNLQIASTKLNSSSSRSHCIFNIKIVKFEDKDEVQYATVSSFSICDLAGAERQKKTLNAGDRLKESQNINQSLHTLRRCFETLRHNQIKNDNLIIPWRDSKLTRVFKRCLCAQHGDRIVMIVNINPAVLLSEETYHVLKASAIAQQIITQPLGHTNQIKSAKMSRFSILVNNHQKDPIQWRNKEIYEEPISEIKEPATVTLSACYDEINRLQREIQKIKAKSEDELSEALQQIANLEQQVKDEYNEKCEVADNFLENSRKQDAKFKVRLKEVEDLYKDRLESKSAYYEDKIKTLNEHITELYDQIENGEQQHESGYDDDGGNLSTASLAKYNQLKDENSELMMKNMNLEIKYQNLENVYQDLLEEKEKIQQNCQDLIERKKKIQLQLEDVKKQFQTDMDEAKKKHEAELHKKELNIDSLEQLLNEAKEEYLELTQELNTCYNENVDLKEKMDEDEAAYRMIIEQKDKDIAEYEERIENLQADIADREGRIEKLDALLEEKIKKEIDAEPFTDSMKKFADDEHDVLQSEMEAQISKNEELEKILKQKQCEIDKLKDVESEKNKELFNTLQEKCEIEKLKNEQLLKILQEKNAEIQNLKVENTIVQFSKINLDSTCRPEPTTFRAADSGVGTDEAEFKFDKRGQMVTNSHETEVSSASSYFSVHDKHKNRTQNLDEDDDEGNHDICSTVGILKTTIHELRSENEELKKKQTLQSKAEKTDVLKSPPLLQSTHKYKLRGRTLERKKTKNNYYDAEDNSDDEDFYPTKSHQKPKRKPKVAVVDNEDKENDIQKSASRKKLFDETTHNVNQNTDLIDAPIEKVILTPRILLPRCKKRLN